MTLALGCGGERNERSAVEGIEPDRPLSKAPFWIALIAGVGLFAIRLNNTASWWTWHLIYTIR